MPNKILIADDSLRIQKELTALLKDSGVEVVTVSNGEHAVRKLASVKPDLVLADVFMPVRSGYEVCEYIKNNEEFAHVGVLLLASKMEPYDEKEAQRVRADGKLEKPFADSAAVLSTIQQHLQKAAASKPAPKAPPIEEFAAAVPAAPEPEPEPEMFSTRPAAVTFQAGAPVGFSDMVEEAAPAAPEPAVDLSQATQLTTTAELRQRVEATAPAPAELAAAPAEPLPAAEVAPAEEPAPAPLAGFEPPPPTPASERTIVEKPELAAAWEMTGPPPGAPEIPSGPDWDSQWKGGEEAAAVEEAPPAETPPAQPYAPEEFAAAMTAAQQAAAAEVARAGATEVSPEVVEKVVNQVLERLSPQITETIAREIVRPLAEALLKEKLKS